MTRKRLLPFAGVADLLAFVKAYRLDLHDPVLARQLAAINPERPRATDARILKSIRQRIAPYVAYHEEYPFVVAPNGSFNGKILFGYQVANRLPLLITEEQLLRHVGIYGGTGAGKTTLLRSLINQVTLGRRVVLLDIKDDSLSLAVHDDRFLILSPAAKLNLIQIPDFLTREEFVIVFCETFCKSMFSAERQKAVLFEALMAAYAEHETPCLKDVAHYIKKRLSPKCTFSERDAAQGVLNRLNRLKGLSPVPYATRHGISWSTLFKHSLYLNSLLGDEMTTFQYSLLVTLLYLHNRRNNIRDQLTHVLVNDEGNAFWSAAQSNIEKMPLLVNLQGLIREFGLALIHTSIDQASLHPILKSNTYTSIMMNASGSREIRELRQHFSLTPTQLDYAEKRLCRGQFLLRFGDGWRDTILAQFPRLPIEKTVSPADRAAAEERINRYTPPDLPAPVQTKQVAEVKPDRQSTEPDTTPPIATPTRPHPDSSVHRPQNGPASPTIQSPAGTRPSTAARPEPSTAPHTTQSSDTRKDGTLPFPEPPEERRPPTKLTAKEEVLLRTCTERLLIATEAYKRAGIARQAGQTAKTRLMKLGLLTASKITARPGRGGNALLLEPTATGYKLLGREQPKGTRGGDSAQHRWLIQELAACIPDAHVEFMLGGQKSVDLFLRYNPALHERISFHMEEEPAPNAHLAIEVECSNPVKTGAANVSKNHDVGIDHTLVAVLPKHVATTKTGLAQHVPEELHSRFTVVNVFDILTEEQQ
jgi:hypothetical protein